MTIKPLQPYTFLSNVMPERFPKYQKYLFPLAAAAALLATTCAVATPPSHTQEPPQLASAPQTPQPEAITECSSSDQYGTIVGNDPATGRNAQVDFEWQHYCYSSDYQLQIAKDPDFTIIVLDTGAYRPASADSPAAYFPAGGLAPSPSSLTRWAQLEAGKTYYWRVRVVRAATGQFIRSPWSEVKSFTIEP